MPSNDLLARYLQAVGFWLPRATKDDILAEISEDLHSQMDDRAASLGRPLNEDEVAQVLKQRGHPVVVASAYLPQQSLIGPVLFPSYKMTLKITFFCYLVPWLLWVTSVVFTPKQPGAAWAMMHSLLPWWFSVLNTFVVITLAFYAMDRGWLKAKFARDWDPRKLPKINPMHAHRKWEDIVAVSFGFLYLVWLLAVPDLPFLVLGPAAFFVKAAPVWRSVYPLLVILAVAGIAQAAVSLRRHLPPWERPVFNIVTSSLTLWVVTKLLHTHTLFVARDQPALQYTAITNVIVYICLAGTALGLSIGLIVHVWRAVEALVRSRPPVIPAVEEEKSNAIQ